MKDTAATVMERCELLGDISEEPGILVRPYGSRAMRMGRFLELIAEAESPSERKDHEYVSDLRVTAGPYEFMARWERERAPETCEAFEGLLPFRNKIIHVRWSGESAWIPLGDFEVGVGFENHTSYPAPGQILLYPGGYSETEILFPYGGTRFASIVGQLAGNHFLTITEGHENLRELGELVLWEGARDIVFDRA
jgi:hypothetical protein